MPTTRRKTIFYIDGFNLFHALRARRWKKYYWLDLSAFSSKILAPMQSLVVVKYFTSRAVGDPHGQKRQNTYIEALETLECVQIQYGKFTTDDQECSGCRKVTKVHHEKQTDVNIAISLLTDAQEDRFDDAILVTADSDQVGTVGYVTKTYPGKRVIVAFPPGRHSKDLEYPISSKTCHLGQREFEQSQFPSEIKSRSGHPLVRPHSWV